MRRVAQLALVLALASCTSGTAKPTASGAPTPSATTAPASSSQHSTPPARAVVLVVERKKQPGLWVYRVGQDQRATLVRRIQAAGNGGRPAWTSVSSGQQPVVCTVWERDDRDDDPIWCYPWGKPGAALPAEGDGYTVAIRPDGRAVAWQSNVHPRDENASRFDLVVEPFGDGTGKRQTFVSQSEGLPPGSRPLCADSAGSMTWVADSSLLVQAWGANDFPGELYVLSTEEGPAGTPPRCTDLPEPTHKADDGYNYFTDISGYDTRSFLADEGQYCEIECPDKGSPAPRRHVRVDLRTGRVLAVPVVAAKGRVVESVTGGPQGLVYVTVAADGTGRRVYVRWSADERGVPITGLPADLQTIQAGP